jgi:hypothetical protein
MLYKKFKFTIVINNPDSKCLLSSWLSFRLDIGVTLTWHYQQNLLVPKICLYEEIGHFISLTEIYTATLLQTGELLLDWNTN